jgi:hypothetical protein
VLVPLQYSIYNSRAQDTGMCKKAKRASLERESCIFSISYEKPSTKMITLECIIVTVFLKIVTRFTYT